MNVPRPYTLPYTLPRYPTHQQGLSRWRDWRGFSPPDPQVNTRDARGRDWRGLSPQTGLKWTHVMPAYFLGRGALISNTAHKGALNRERALIWGNTVCEEKWRPYSVAFGHNTNPWNIRTVPQRMQQPSNFKLRSFPMEPLRRQLKVGGVMDRHENTDCWWFERLFLVKANRNCSAQLLQEFE